MGSEPRRSAGFLTHRKASPCNSITVEIHARNRVNHKAVTVIAKGQLVTPDQLELLPLVIGVTGHRDLREEDREALEERVLEIFQTLQARYPDTPLAVLSPLAEGADTLVAQVAVSHGIRLIAPLPMDRAEYEKDFRAPGSLERFRYLLSLADPSFSLPTEAACGHVLSRDGCYAQVGAYVASHCQILIAFWDGTDNGREGGTAQVVKFKLEGIPRQFVPANSLLDIPEAGPVYHVITPRTAHPIPEGKLSLVEKYPGSGNDEAKKKVAFNRIFKHMDSFNQDAVSLASALAAERIQSVSYVFEDPERDRQTTSPRLDLLRYAVVDTLAQHFQRKTLRALVALIILVFILASFFQAHVFLRQLYKISDPAPKPWYMKTVVLIDIPSRVYLTWLDVIYFALLIVAIALFRRALGANCHNKYLDYRAIAEGLRVQFFWRLAGLRDSVADHYLRKQKGDLDWIRNAVRISNILQAPTPTEDTSNQLSLVIDCWVVDQERFFTRRATLALGRSRWIKRMGSGSYYVGLAFLIIRAFAPPDHPVIIALVLALAVVLLVNLYAKVTAFSEHAKQYRRMSTLFDHASRQLKYLVATGDLDQARELVRELGKESLAENGDWVLMHRERPLELPRA